MGGPSNNFDISTPLALATAAGVPFTGAAAAGTYVTPDISNPSHSGVHVYINITALGGTPTLTVTIEGKDPVSGQYFTMLSSTALAAVAFTRLVVYPGIAVVANFSDNDVLPATWRVKAVVAGTTPTVTATIGHSLQY